MTEGDKVRIIAGLHQGKTGKILDKYNLYGGTDTYKVDLDGEGEWAYVDEEQMEPLAGGWTTIKSNGCECGSTAVGSPRHSVWCRLFKEEDE